MWAILYDRYGPPDVMRLAEQPDPTPEEGEVLVRLQTSGVAPFDAKLRAGRLQQHFTLNFPSTPGRDGAGHVMALGTGVTGCAIGDRVCVLAPREGGTAATLIACQRAAVVPAPPGLTPEEAGALMQPGLSAWIAIETAAIAPGMRVLVHGGAGAVGGLMVQLLRHRGAIVTATCRATNRDYVVALGAQRAIAYDTEDFTRIDRQDVVFDLIGGDVHARSYDVLRNEGQMVYLVAAPFEQRSERGITVRRAMVTDRPDAIAAVAELAHEGVWRPGVAATLPLAEIGEAHRRIEAGEVTRGRIVLTI
ncbi:MULTISPECIES: NADP-dependent oxidoreductase [unclassified Chelatococcus]|jgi:NADPH:quinone reductase-like Zn-dependent oxidoreductase|uniref:NADP-dependent oxidoreductase n=1 Tax=unclassified Chelatococcus TaxID=2638111 RepID=UPI001BD0EF17|nr:MULTISPECIES: NADP-dependent oxidoreductase [unclassified Chelatococcus]CAH1648571.1 NADPH:quinone reductase-like Zn-dependent oxidoreductase [Hyphomicrobiales bacterium]MBS7741909.1 NADP-dependent oxidoreductase [Chelatococcus sp. HY11]MBX3541293.1 NADP-dependent oxidoreductase [Chelatococcus sp.]MCO5074814.1 NADP-dependent oxidoreductase [Chelatococcus sp.]CAH1691185.1 NADPH:quinone reductase-like Zn-dependent oxidoreductase [Hyphomicrobiales bacterium]